MSKAEQHFCGSANTMNLYGLSSMPQNANNGQCNEFLYSANITKI